MNEERYATRWRQAVVPPRGLVRRSRALLRHAILSINSAMSRVTEPTFLRCLYCHYVFDDQKRDFERLIRALKELGTFVDSETCIQMLRGEAEIDRRYFHLSFDDGFQNIFTNALPILMDLDVPATIFIPTSLIGADWEDVQHYCSDITHYGATIAMLNWSQVREAKSMGYDIGSHTKTHVRFSEVSKDPARLEDEIRGSKDVLEQKLGAECEFISWPYGRLSDADDESLQMVKDAGYKACFGAFRSTILAEKTDIFRIPRHHFEAQWPVSHVKYFARGNMETQA